MPGPFLNFLKMKRTTCLLAVAVMVLSVSCRTGEAERNYTIGVSQCSEDLWRETVNNEIKRQASFLQNVDVVFRTTKDDSEEQIRDIHELVSLGIDLLIVSPNVSGDLDAVVSEVYRKGIPVVLLDRRIDSDNYTAYVGADNKMLARNLAQYASALIRREGNIVVIRGHKGSTADEERYEGFMSVVSREPGIKVVAEEYGDFLKERAYARMDSILTALPPEEDVDLVFAMNDQMAVGVREAYALRPHSKIPTIIGIDALPGPGGGVEAINDGLIDASFMYPTGGDKVVEVAYNILTRREYERENLLRTAVVDRSNVRIIRLQNDQIDASQKKFDVLTEMLSSRNMAYSKQKWTIQMMTILLAVIFGSAILLAYLIVRQRRLNRELNQKNKEIESQVETLTAQREQLKALSVQLEEAIQAKLVFFTDISHEFKTPLTLILGPVTEMLQSGRLSLEDNDILQLVKRNGQKLMNLLNQILEFRTYENGKMTLDRETGRLDHFLIDINQLFKQNMTQKGVTFEFRADGSDFTMVFDKDKMDKIYFNLLSNALKYVDENGRIEVSLSREDGETPMARLEVSNTGSFIPEDKWDDVFRRFYHLDKEHDNSGIGLALSKYLVEAHRGTITVTSDKEKGTTFTVLLPIFTGASLEEEGGEVISSHKYVADQMELSKSFYVGELGQERTPSGSEDKNLPKVLVIEDNADMRQYIKLVLSNYYRITTASNGADGIDKALAHIPDLILTDLLMPGIDGFEVCRTLKDNVITKNIPIICLTACATDEQKIMSYDSGADAYLTKPFNANVLRTRISKLIEKNQDIAKSIDNNLFPDKDIMTLGARHQKLIEDFRKYVEDHIHDSISIDQITEHLGVSKSSLYRQFKEITDYNPVDIISLIRLKQGIKLMLLERKTVSEAAFDSGFSSPSYFTKTFIKYYKETPTEYIRRYTNLSQSHTLPSQ